ncbi:MAG: hypothetical protein V3V84_08820 [Candidatus Bathyarchaeia archaeon]
MAKTSIIIKGGICSTTRIKAGLGICNLVEENKLHYATEFVYSTRKAAVKALSEAYQYLKEDFKVIDGYKRGSSLSYDAATATIVDANI